MRCRVLHSLPCVVSTLKSTSAGVAVECHTSNHLTNILAPFRPDRVRSDLAAIAFQMGTLLLSFILYERSDSKTIICLWSSKFQDIIEEGERGVDTRRKVCWVVLLVAIHMTECTSYIGR